MEKVFGIFATAADLNETARNLREEDVFDEVRLLAKENGIDAQRVEDFLLCKFDDLVVGELPAKVSKAVDTDSEETAAGKLQREAKAEKSYLAPPIVEYLKKRIETDSAFAALLLKTENTLKKCIAHVTSEAGKVLSRKDGYLPPDVVFGFVESYYAGKKAVADDAGINAAVEAEEKKPRPKPKLEVVKSVPVQKPAEKKAEPITVAKTVKPTKGMAEGQIDLFGFGG